MVPGGGRVDSSGAADAHHIHSRTGAAVLLQHLVVSQQLASSYVVQGLLRCSLLI